jgi:hypothetical protein
MRDFGKSVFVPVSKTELGLASKAAGGSRREISMADDGAAVG